MQRPPFLQAYGALPLGGGTSLVIGITQDGIRGMGINAVARLLASDTRTAYKIIYGNTRGFTGVKNDTSEAKPQSGNGVSPMLKCLIPSGHRAKGAVIHLVPASGIFNAVIDRLEYMVENPKRFTVAQRRPLKAFLKTFGTRGLEEAIDKALGWEPADNYVRSLDEHKSYKTKFEELCRESFRKYGHRLTANAFVLIEEIIKGMVKKLREQRKRRGSKYLHDEFNAKGEAALMIAKGMAMEMLMESNTYPEFLARLTSWRSGQWQQRLDLQAA